MKYISTISGAKKFLLAAMVSRIYLGFVIAITLLYSQDRLPSYAQSNVANSGYYPYVYSTRNIKSGSIILLASDLAVGKRKTKITSSNTIISPLEILGCRAIRELPKSQAITYQDLDFNTRRNGSLNIATILKLAEQLRIARLRWSSPTDAYWEFYSPGNSILEHQGGAVVVAAKLIRKGTFIENASDIERIIVPLSHIPAGAIGTPFRAIGSAAKYDLPKGTVISMQDLEFSSRLSIQQKVLLRRKFKFAGQKWSGLSVKDFLKDDLLLKL